MPTEVIAAIVSDAVPRPSSMRSDLPPELEKIVMSALEKDPDRRLQSAQALASALERFAPAERIAQLIARAPRRSSVSLPDVTASVGAPVDASSETQLLGKAPTVNVWSSAPPPARRSYRRLAAALCLATAALGIGGFLVARSFRTPIAEPSPSAGLAMDTVVTPPEAPPAPAPIGDLGAVAPPQAVPEPASKPGATSPQGRAATVKPHAAAASASAPPPAAAPAPPRIPSRL